MDTIRRRQIEEVLNSDMEINKFVFQIQKRNAGLMTENLLPYTQMNSEVLETVSAVVNQLFIILEEKKSDVQNIVNQVYNDPNNRVNAPKDADLFNDLTAFEEVLRLYNTAVEPYNGIRANLTQQTKGEILNKVRQLLNPVAYITNGIKNIIEKQIRKYESLNGAAEV